MKNVFIIGGAGKVGRRLAQKLSEQGHTPRSLYRAPEQEDSLLALGPSPLGGAYLSLMLSASPPFTERVRSSCSPQVQAVKAGKI